MSRTPARNRLVARLRGEGSFTFAARWGLVLFGILCIAAFAISTRYSLSATPGTHHSLRMTGGRVHYWHDSTRLVPDQWRLSANRSDIEWLVDYHVYPGRWFVRIPLWIPAVLSLLLSALLFAPRWRHPPGCCVKCGYDLRGQESGGRSLICPECGHANTRVSA